MKWFKSAFARVHFAFVAALFLTITLGALLAMMVPDYKTFATVHFLAGLSILIVPAAVLLATKSRRMVLRAWGRRLRLTKKDFADGFTLALAAKLAANLMMSAIVLQLLTGIGMKTGLLYQMLPNFGWLGFHRAFLYIIPSLITLHVVLIKAAKRSGARQPVRSVRGLEPCHKAC